MKTKDLIQKLSEEFVENESKNKSFFGSSIRSFLLKWFVGAAALALFFIYLLPVREDLAMSVQAPQYLIESTLWFFIATFTARLVFLSSIPGRLLKRDTLWVGVFALLLTGLVLLRSRFEVSSFGLDLHQELDWYRGRCGGAILFIGTLGTGLFMTWMKKGASLQPGYTGLGLALSSGALASFVLQFACVHENSLHIFIWHFAPVALLAVLGGFFGRFFLRW